MFSSKSFDEKGHLCERNAPLKLRGSLDSQILRSKRYFSIRVQTFLGRFIVFLWERRVDSGFKLKKGVGGVIFRRLLGLKSLAKGAETTVEALIFLSRWCYSILFCCIFLFGVSFY